MNRASSLFAIVLATASCLEVPPSGVGACPVDVDAEGALDVTPFVPVSAVLEQRCGSLDCHGSLGRPLRIYGYTGLRHAATYTVDENGQVRLAEEVKAYVDPVVAEANDLFPGGGAAATTPTEMAQTIRSICGLQPEVMRQVVLEGAEAEKLLLLSKPLHLERHKGWKVFERGSLDHRCIASWLQSKQPSGEVDDDACKEALAVP
jgi:hypothetical protein